MNYNKLQFLITKNDLSFEKAARISGFKSGVGFKQMMQNKTMNVAALERLADYFKKPIAYFFDQEEGQSYNLNEPQEAYGSNYKNKYIEMLEKDNEALRKAIDKLSNNPGYEEAKSKQVS